jgi:hypothetical protein
MPLRALLAALAAALPLVVFAEPAPAAPRHQDGADYIRQNGYQGPKTCETCHEGTARKFLGTVHWKHASRAPHVKGADPKVEWGMRNRSYTFCNGNDIVNNLKESPANEKGKTKFSGCNSCHPGDHVNDVGSTGPAAEASIDCLICHSSAYDYSKRKAFKAADGKVVMGQDRGLEAALAVGRPSVKNCMTCHESAGGGVLIKRGFAFDAEHDAHAAKAMVCVDCHKAKDHRVPTGLDPNNWASDGVLITCADCHGEKPHQDADYDAHTARVACQTCHIPTTGGAVAKDFTRWTKLESGFWEPSTINRGPQQATPVYAWYAGQVLNAPHFIGPMGQRQDKAARITPFKVYEGRAFYDRLTGQLLTMDFGPPIASGDALAGVASAARTLGLAKYDPVPGWQTVYFASSHLVTRTGALTCEKCHAPTGRLDFEALGYPKAEVEKRHLRSAALWFDKQLAKDRAKED